MKNETRPTCPRQLTGVTGCPMHFNFCNADSWGRIPSPSSAAVDHRSEMTASQHIIIDEISVA